MGWICEVVGTLFTWFTPTLASRYVYFPDAIVMFVVIPFIHLINDEDCDCRKKLVQRSRILVSDLQAGIPTINTACITI